MSSFSFGTLKTQSSPYINRFLQPDTVIPDLSNPQSWNRFSYVLNNSINASDPSGHICVGEPEECLDDDGSKGAGFTGHDDSGVKDKKKGCGGPGQISCLGKTKVTGPSTVQIAQDGMSGLYITLFPAGSVPSQYRTSEQLSNAENWAAWGLFMDILEGIMIAFPGDLFFGEYVMSAGDTIITGGACYQYGECYVGKPDSSLPTMLVVNQDMIITGTDLIAPVAGGLVGGIPTGGPGYYPGSVVTDAVTTGGSLFYDIGRITGEVPNYVSIGFTIKGDWYILIYP